MKEIPENPERKIRLEQISVLIERHNYLVDEVSALQDSFKEKDKEIKKFRTLITEEMTLLNKILKELKDTITEVERHKKNLSSEFKQIIKRPLFEKLEKRVDDLKYEDYIYREELWRKTSN